MLPPCVAMRERWRSAVVTNQRLAWRDDTTPEYRELGVGSWEWEFLAPKAKTRLGQVGAALVVFFDDVQGFNSQ